MCCSTAPSTDHKGKEHGSEKKTGKDRPQKGGEKEEKAREEPKSLAVKERP